MLLQERLHAGDDRRHHARRCKNVYPSTDAAARRASADPVRPVAQFGLADPLSAVDLCHDDANNTDKHAATVALTDRGDYVLGARAARKSRSPTEDTEEVNVPNLPTIYRAIWETARKHDIPDDITKRIVAMYAYDVDSTKKITPGDSIELLEPPRTPTASRTCSMSA